MVPRALEHASHLSKYLATGNQPQPQRAGLRRGKSLLAREEDQHESGLALFKRGATLRRKQTSSSMPEVKMAKSRGCMDNIGPGPKDPWFIYCYILTCFVPPILLRACGEYSYPASIRARFTYNTIRYPYTGTAASLAREDGASQYHCRPHGRSRFPHVRFHRNGLRDAAEPLPLRTN